jgi:uncharacterized phage protein gp47/JayE
MPFARPVLQDLVSQALTDIQAQLDGVDPLLANAVLRVLGVTLAEAFNSQYGYQDYIALQAVPFTAVDEAFAGWAALKDEQQKPASQATGSWTFAASADDLTIDVGAAINRSDGVAYIASAEATSAGGSITVPVTAVVAGSAGTIATGVSGVLASPVAGIATTGTGIAGAAGADVEVFADFKTRVLQIYAQPPQGGDASDYVEWALQVSGVTRAWCAPSGLGAGTVVVYFMMDLAETEFGGFPQGNAGVASGETRDTPATGDLLAVADWIFPLRPATALVYAVPPRPNTATFTIALAGATTAVKAAINAAIDAVFLANGSPGGVLLSTGVQGGVIDLSDVEAAIAAVQGARGFVIETIACDHGTVSPGVQGNIAAAAGYLTVRGPTTWA